MATDDFDQLDLFENTGKVRATATRGSAGLSTTSQRSSTTSQRSSSSSLQTSTTSIQASTTSIQASSMGSKPRSTTIARTEARSSRKAGRGGGRKPPAGSGDGGGKGGGELDASLKEETRRRYLNYALSVITSRALPDARDGLKPVQRRILYAMYHDEKLYPDAKHRKSAKVVGTVIGKYHPHGDVAVYDAMVRMAQDFSLRVPLVDGSGNFGSLDGDGAAAYRYTECRLAPPAAELLSELRSETVPFRDTFDATTVEPTVLPARFPNLLVNGSTGIAVGMATNIPPHNLREITKALIALADDRELPLVDILKYVKGPDFPTGGQILNTKAELRQIYETGSGPIKMRALWKIESLKRGGESIILTSVPYGINKAALVEKIADVIIGRKLPLLLDVRDESTDDVRVVLEIKRDADPQMVMAYLFKHTPVQMNFNVNLTCLFPTANQEVMQPERTGIKRLLEEFLDFRFDVVKKRFEFELRKLETRIHILEGFVEIFDALDETIRIIRRSDGKADAAKKIIKRFELSAAQVEAILELKLHQLAKLAILVIREELTDKRARARAIRAILKSDTKLWNVVKKELAEIAEKYGTPRKTKTGGVSKEVEFDEEDFIIAEEANVIVTRDGWIKRQGEIKDLSKQRVREGDAVMAVLPGSTRANVVFFSSYGTAYVTKINDVPATTGYGVPAQKLFKFKDGERIIAAMTLDPRAMRATDLLTIGGRGFGQRFALDNYLEVTTRSGRKFARPPAGDEIVGVVPSGEEDVMVVATRRGHVLYCRSGDINKLENPGKGVTVIKVAPDDQVIGFISGTRRKETLSVESAKGGRGFELHADARKIKGRGGKGTQIVKRSTLKMKAAEPIVVLLATADGGKGVH